MSKTTVTLIWPSIAPVLKQEINSSILPTHLKKLIKKSSFTADESRFQRLLINQFSDDISGSDIPLAGLYGDNLLFADPCHLHPDRDRLVLFSDDLDITQSERLGLAAEVQPLLDEFGAKLLVNTAEQHWLLQFDNMPDLILTSLEDVSGKGVDDSLPQGNDRKHWLRLLNEIQMQLYSAEVNKKRTEQGKLPINSLWFWGMGDLALQADKWSAIVGTDYLLSVLAKNSKAALHPEVNYSDVSIKGAYLHVLDEVALNSDWQQQLDNVDDEILKPLWNQCKQAKISSVKLHIPDYGYFALTPFDCWKFWR